jgi:hypothetical protein
MSTEIPNPEHDGRADSSSFASGETTDFSAIDENMPVLE